MSWDRNSKWCQGAVLSGADYQSICHNSNYEGAIAVSHSCDIANSLEPKIEFISIKNLEKADGNLRYGKNPRKLHLPILHNAKSVFIELCAKDKIIIEKEQMSFSPSSEFELESEGVYILQSWLSARYKRHALPDSLVERLRPLMAFMEKELKKELEHIIGLWIDYQPRSELLDSNSYELWLNIVYTLDKDEGSRAADNLIDKINEKFSSLVSQDSGKVYLVACEKYSELEYTLSDIRNTFEYRFEYISYRTNPPGPIAE